MVTLKGNIAARWAWIFLSLSAASSAGLGVLWYLQGLLKKSPLIRIALGGESIDLDVILILATFLSYIVSSVSVELWLDSAHENLALLGVKNLKVDTTKRANFLDPSLIREVWRASRVSAMGEADWNKSPAAFTVLWFLCSRLGLLVIVMSLKFEGFGIFGVVFVPCLFFLFTMVNMLLLWHVRSRQAEMVTLL